MHKWIIDKEEVFPSGKANVFWHDETFFDIEYEGKRFRAELQKFDIEKATLEIKVNHRVFSLKRENALSDLIKSMGLDKIKLKKLTTVEAPMPGRVIELYVQVGDEIKPGDSLLSLEAMKMENILKSEGAGRVKKIEVKPDQVVDKGFVMIRFD